ncbi:MAG: hotdog domain-containing protein [Candidatus Acidiferrales bacterium]
MTTTGKPGATGKSEQQFTIGLEFAVEKVVTHQWTLSALDPSLPPVLSTPAMIGLMEWASADAVKPELPPGAITVGTRIGVDHLKAITAGATVRATARLAKQEGRFLIFEVEARSGEHVLGRVFRAVVHTDKFRAKAHTRHKP